MHYPRGASKAAPGPWMHTFDAVMGGNHVCEDRARCCSARWRRGGSHGVRRRQAGSAAKAPSRRGGRRAPLPPSELETQLPPRCARPSLKPFTGDLDEMVKRRVVRIGVTFNRTFYFVDKGVQRGMAYEYGQLIEERLNKHFKTGTRQQGFT